MPPADTPLQDLVGRLFAIATSRLEDLHETALSGQAAEIDAARELTATLRSGLTELTTLADALAMLLGEEK